MARPKEFRNAAEKQKAYRERKKAAIAEQAALRNAPPAHGTSEYWQKIKDQTTDNHWKLIGRCPTESEYDQWCKDIASNLAKWNEASSALYLIKNPNAKRFL
jgi:hypothetical protein